MTDAVDVTGRDFDPDGDGRVLGAVTVPAGMLLPAARVVGLVQRIVPFHIPVEFEGAYFCRYAAGPTTLAPEPSWASSRATSR
jgi:hypothetical protein